VISSEQVPHEEALIYRLPNQQHPQAPLFLPLVSRGDSIRTVWKPVCQSIPRKSLKFLDAFIVQSTYPGAGNTYAGLCMNHEAQPPCSLCMPVVRVQSMWTEVVSLRRNPAPGNVHFGSMVLKNSKT